MHRARGQVGPENSSPFFWTNSTEKQKPFFWIQTPQPASPGMSVSLLGGRCRAALFPNALEADFPRAGLSTEGADPTLPGLSSCNLGLFLRWNRWRIPELQHLQGLASVSVRLGNRKDHYLWVLIAENIVLGLHSQAQGPGFILLQAPWLWPELCAFSRTSLETRQTSLRGLFTA